jgi:hypothetical protein
VRRTVEELPFELPPELGGGSSHLFTRGLQWAAVGVDPANLRATLVVRSASESAARDLSAYLPKMLRCASEAIEWDVDDKIRTALFDSLLKLFEPKVEGNHITIDIDVSEGAVANLRIIDLLEQGLESQTRRQRNIKRFTQIVTAMLNYHDTYKSFPPADKHRDEEGKPKLSWRVYLLPYLNQGQLYDEFHLDEPWDSPHNKQLLEKMPDIYRSTSFFVPPEGAVKTGYTTFQAPVGEDTVFGNTTPTKMSNVADGMSHTIVLVEVVPERAVPWTAPADYEFDPDNPAAGIQMGDEGRWLVAVADMTVQQLPSNIPARTVLCLFQMSDGRRINLRGIR